MSNTSHNTNIVMNVNAKDHTSKAFDNINRNLSKTKKQAGAVQQQFRFMRGGMGQLGHQIQDVAVQLQMGQNALLVFGQQGSQVASLMGPHGAVVGAFLAVGAAIATSMLPNLFKTSEAMKKAEEGTKDLALKVNKLTGAQRELAAIQLAQAIKDVTSDMEEQTEASEKNRQSIAVGFLAKTKYVESEKSFASTVALSKAQLQILTEQQEIYNHVKAGGTVEGKKYIDSLDKQIAQFGKSADEIKLLNVETKSISDTEKNLAKDRLTRLAQLRNSAADEIKLQKDRKDALSEFWKTVDEEAEAIAKKEKQDLNEKDRLKNSLGALKKKLMDERQLLAAQFIKDQELLEEAVAKEVISEVKKANLLLQVQKKYYADVEALRDDHSETLEDSLAEFFDEQTAKKLEDQLKKQAIALEDFKQTYRPIFDELGDGFVDAITGAENFADAIKSMAKNVVDSLLRIAVQKLIIDQLFGAFTGALGPGAGNGGGMGNLSTLSQRGGINNLPSFDGGGFTGSGARSGKLDGKGGFMAMVHPNETIIDHTKGQSTGGVTVVQNITVNAGVAQTVKAEMMNLLPSFAQAAKNGIVDSKLRGGQYARALA
jgi:hypothetical protein